MKSVDEVVLDGIHPGLSWPLQLAENLLSDPTPWGLGVDSSGPNRLVDYCYLASFVNAYYRNRGGYVWVRSILDNAQATGSFELYTTQDLLDVLFYMCRIDRFNQGALNREEPRLRMVLYEVVRRIRSHSPPIFNILPPKGS